MMKGENLVSNKMILGLATLIILIGAVGFLFYQQSMEIKQLKQQAVKDDKLLEQQRNQQTPEVVQGELDTSHPEFHLHEDGTPHIGTHEKTKSEYTAPEGAVTQPDFSNIDPNDDPVKDAYNRLEYIKNNPYAWGGVYSERATELIAELMPNSKPIQLIDHNHGEVVGELIFELCQQNDPRAAETLIAMTCDTGIGMVNIDDALEEIGPPAIPYILPYLERGMQEEGSVYINWAVFDSLTRIGVRYRDDLGGIIDHIIIPKFKEIAADEDNKRYEWGPVRDAKEALDRLQ